VPEIEEFTPAPAAPPEVPAVPPPPTVIVKTFPADIPDVTFEATL
jgi:hypothetical protein